MDECLQLESEPKLVAAARAWLAELLDAWEMSEEVDDAVLVASELVSNAVIHARTSIQLRVACVDSTVRVEVFDENSRLPALAPCPADATSGRGLNLVAAMSTGWESRAVITARSSAPPSALHRLTGLSTAWTSPTPGTWMRYSIRSADWTATARFTRKAPPVGNCPSRQASPGGPLLSPRPFDRERAVGSLRVCARRCPPERQGCRTGAAVGSVLRATYPVVV